MRIQRLYKEFPFAVSLGVKGVRRAAQTAAALGQTGLEWLTGGRPPAPVVARKAFERLGATYIKLGQLIASSPSLFPEAYVREFQRCLDKTDPIDFHQMAGVLEKELGPGYLGKIFSEINPVPIASASIAQVYAARLTSGEQVVIKIQRPGVKEILIADLNFLFIGARVLESLVRGAKHAAFSGILSEIRKTVLEECNFITEARNLETFTRFLESTGKTNVVTPRIYYRATSERVLTMERLHGIPLTDREQFLKSTDYPQAVLGAAFETWMESTTGCELFHADLHAGNLLIMEGGRVGFIDFGIVGRISRQTQQGVRALVAAMMMQDYPGMAEAMLAIGMTGKSVDTRQLADDLAALYEAGEAIETQINMDAPGKRLSDPEQFMLQMVKVAEAHGIRFPREFTMLLKQFLYFDSYADILFDVPEFGHDMIMRMEDWDDLDAL
ncbi:MAG: ABC1 kinase family protein [Thermodesulfobacteriota bacterium]